MTSVTGDQSNVGFVLINMRTKDTKFYEIPGAEEFSAMSSAEGKVQNLRYTATFPLLLNVADRPTYFMSLKDNAGLVKMYAFVDVEQYQLVGTGGTVAEARAQLCQGPERRRRRLGGGRTGDRRYSGDSQRRLRGLHPLLLQARRRPIPSTWRGFRPPASSPSTRRGTP